MYFLFFVLVLIGFSYADRLEYSTEGEGYPKKLTLRNNPVFESIPLYTLSSKGLVREHVYKNYTICESEEAEATFMPVGCTTQCIYQSYEDIYKFTGVYGREITRTSIGQDLKHCSRSGRKFTDSFSLRTIDTDFRKSMYQVQQEPGIYAYREVKEEKILKHSNRKSRSMQSWNHLTIECLIVIDNAFYKKLDRDYEYIIQYMQIFWSAVDLKFRNITQPKINVNVTGVIVVKEEKMLNYIHGHQLPGQQQTVIMSEALDNFHEIKKYFQNNTVPNYDVIVTITGLEGVLKDEDNKISPCYGISYRNGVCTEKSNGIIIQDNADYTGVNHGVHELGHILGLRHDGERMNEYNVDYSQCSSQHETTGDYTIMQNRTISGPYNYVWSNCSLKYFQSVQNSASVSCIAQ